MAPTVHLVKHVAVGIQPQSQRILLASNLA
jgi:hypothetical protein